MLGLSPISLKPVDKVAPHGPSPATPRVPLPSLPRTVVAAPPRREAPRRAAPPAASRAALRPGTSIPRLDGRLTTPRQVGELSMELYLSGWLSYEESALLGFQPELHPDYECTIGALTGEPAEPDRPRDFISLWQDRLAFELRHNPHDLVLHQRIERIISVLIAASASYSPVSAAA